MDDPSTSVDATPAGPTSAGWYPDVNDPHTLRWWHGSGSAPAVRPNGSLSGRGTNGEATERVIAVARVHPLLAVAPPALLALFVLGAIVVFPQVWGDTGVFIAWVAFSMGLPLGTLLIMRGILLLTSSRLTLTSGRIFARLALVRRRTRELLLADVESVHVSQGLVARAMGYGTIVLRATGGLTFPIWGIGNVHNFQEQIQQQVDGAVNRV